jgi:hypothetical protein
MQKKKFIEYCMTWSLKLKVLFLIDILFSANGTSTLLCRFRRFLNTKSQYMLRTSAYSFRVQYAARPRLWEYGTEIAVVPTVQVVPDLGNAVPTVPGRLTGLRRDARPSPPPLAWHVPLARGVDRGYGPWGSRCLVGGSTDPWGGWAFRVQATGLEEMPTPWPGVMPRPV